MTDDLTQLTDEELEQHGFDLDRQRLEFDSAIREQQLAQQAEVTRRSDAARLERLADTLSEDDRTALREYLEANPAPEPPAEEPETEAETVPAEPEVEG